MYKRILVTGQEISSSLAPLDKGLRLCDKQGSVEWFLTVYHSAFELAVKDDPDTENEAIALYQRHRQAQVDRLLASNKLLDRVRVDTSWHPNFLVAALRQAERYMPDLVVVPRLPNEDLVDWLVGGDEQDLVRKIKDPLLLATSDPWPTHPRIAVAIDPFHLDNRDEAFEITLLQLADQIANHIDAELHVVHCFQSLPQSVIFDEQIVTDYSQLQERVGTEHRERIEALLESIGRPVGGPLLHLIEGDVISDLPLFCQREKIDLLIVGATEHSAFERLLLGSTTERLLSKIDKDLLIIHRN